MYKKIHLKNLKIKRTTTNSVYKNLFKEFQNVKNFKM